MDGLQPLGLAFAFCHIVLRCTVSSLNTGDIGAVCGWNLFLEIIRVWICQGWDDKLVQIR